jgi:hypothetical protein
VTIETIVTIKTISKTMKTPMQSPFLILILLLSFSLLFAPCSFGQQGFNDEGQKSQNTSLERNKFDLGFGFGLDYGGLIGAKLSFAPIKHLTVFASGGYHMVAFGWQVGVAAYALPKVPAKKFRIYGKIMYGSNRVIIVDGASELDKNYIGFTPGIGLEFRFGKKVNNGLNADLNFPIGNQEFQDDLQFLKDSPLYEVTDPLPVAISVGYHIEF